MDKIYTAQEMRDMVVGLEQNLKYGMERVVIASPKLIEMLRQAADALEREEKQPKRYEYSLVLSGGQVSSIHDEVYCRYLHTLRREVGEWEEVKDGE